MDIQVLLIIIQQYNHYPVGISAYIKKIDFEFDNLITKFLIISILLNLEVSLNLNLKYQKT